MTNEIEQLRHIIQTLRSHERIEISRDREDEDKISIVIKSTYKRTFDIPYSEQV